MKAAAADIEKRQAKLVIALVDGQQKIVLTFIEQRFVTDGAGRQNTHYLAFHRPLAGGRVTNLFSNGY